MDTKYYITGHTAHSGEKVDKRKNENATRMHVHEMLHNGICRRIS